MQKHITPEQIKIVQDPNLGIAIMYNAGKWLLDSGRNPNKYWLPENMNREFLMQHINPEEFYVALVDGKPAASLILQEDERNQSWKSVDGDTPKQALYMHWLAVHRDFAGMNLPRIMTDLAIKEAKKRGHKRIRLDTTASQPKLRKLYDGLGFKLVHIEPEDYRDTAYYQMDL